MNHHHGMQAEERFDLTRLRDSIRISTKIMSRGGVTVGDITAVTIFQASMDVPQQVLQKDWKARFSVKHGEMMFDRLCRLPYTGNETEQPLFRLTESFQSA